jgi:hypothetical protein
MGADLRVTGSDEDIWRGELDDWTDEELAKLKRGGGSQEKAKPLEPERENPADVDPKMSDSK